MFFISSGREGNSCVDKFLVVREGNLCADKLADHGILSQKLKELKRKLKD